MERRVERVFVLPGFFVSRFDGNWCTGFFWDTYGGSGFMDFLGMGIGLEVGYGD
jgi:hypothetical protein